MTSLATTLPQERADQDTADLAGMGTLAAKANLPLPKIKKATGQKDCCARCAACQ